MKHDRPAELHFYEWRTGAWAMSETRERLDATGRGIYRELLDQCYATGSFPDDPKWICRRCACTEEQYSETWPLIARHFPISTRGGSHRHNIFADIVRKGYEEYVCRQKNNRSKGKQINVLRDGGNETELTTIESGEKQNRPNVTLRYDTLRYDTVEEEKLSSPIQSDAQGDVLVLNGNAPQKRPLKTWFDDHHEIWYKTYWLRSGKVPSRKAFEKAINRLHDRDHLGYNQARILLLATIPEYRQRFESTEFWEAKAKMLPATFLNQERWTDEIGEQAEKKRTLSVTEQAKLAWKKEQQDAAV